MEIITKYFEAFEAANSMPHYRPVIELTSRPGWFKMDGKTIGRKTIIDMTERLINRAAGRGQLTNAELLSAK